MASNKKILLIEDDEILLSNLKEILEEEDFIVESASDGEAGIDKIYHYKPDLIICDISIPKKNGYQVLKEISEKSKVKDIPFIYLTAKTQRDDLRLGMQLGADDYIFKPFDIDDLLNSIELRFRKKTNYSIKEISISNSNKKTYNIDDSILMKVGNSKKMCLIKNLKFIKSENPYISIKFTDMKNILLRETLDDWENKLPEKYFIRIHRSTIINKNYITSIQKEGKSCLTIQLSNESGNFTVSKRYLSKVKNRLK